VGHQEGDGAGETAREMREHEREARERDPDERDPGRRAAERDGEAEADKPAPPGSASTGELGGGT
jgi:hypothetical protein